MSHIILTSALIALIFLMQFSFMYVVDNMRTEITQRELKEIADYVSDSLGNLYLLANSTDCDNVTLKKTLSIPSHIQGLTYNLSLYYDTTTNEAISVNASTTGSLKSEATSWLPPSLKVNLDATQTIVSDVETVVAGCARADSYVSVWIASK